MRPLLRSVLALTASAVVAAGCSSPAKRFPDLATEYVYTTLTFSPSGATQTGLHTHDDPKTGAVLALDTLLDDFSQPSLDRQRAFYRDFKTRLAALDREKLDPQMQADYDLLANAVDYALYGLDEERFTERKPQLYAENLGNADRKSVV